MKKQLFLTALAAFAMVSCSEENVLDTNKEMQLISGLPWEPVPQK